ncbi:Type 2C Phosphatase [Fusarium albosuccineum]|uniref:Type 2C Phosphatase n=1 Tax=Fusarium albosuccineum TaxID=1237068 RepID=A0A8H4PEW8_9HYPO|nr:Type 2C Phosphatase [Fusarium albosuccineum]
MFRIPVRTSRTATLPLKRVSVRAARVRFSSTQAAQSSASNSARYAWSAAAIIGIGGSGVYLLNSKDNTSSGTQNVPALKEVASEDHISVDSPVKVLSLEAANAKLRQDVHTFVFQGSGGVKGRVDVARVSSNNPVEDDWDLKVAKGIDGAATLYSGVYDGHAGWATSQVLRKALVAYVSGALSSITTASSDELVDDAIKKAFVRLDDRIFSNAAKAVKAGYDPGAAEVISAVAPAITGSCALLSIYEPRTSTLKTAVTGDSRAVRGAWSPEASKYEADVLSKDQTGFNADEVNRLDREHPGEKGDILNPDSGRLLGMAVTRAFGDHRWKWSEELILTTRDNFYGTSPRPNYKTPPYMTARPEVTTRKIQTEDFVILASDGLWDMISNQDAVTCVSRWLAAKKVGRPEPFKETKPKDGLEDGWQATPEHFVIEDLDSAAVCLVKNALGGSRRKLFLGALTTYAPLSRNVRDDMTVQVIFFKDPYERK